MRHPLLRVAVAGLRAHARRMLLTATAVVIAVGFLAGSLVYGDTARRAFYTDLARSARNVDVVVRPDTEWGGARVSPQVLSRLAALPGVAAADGRVTETVALLDSDGKLITNFGQAGFGVSLPGTPGLARYDLVTGRLPSRPGEVAVDAETVARAGFTLGGVVQALDRTGEPRRLTLVGLVDLGVNRQFTGLSVAALGAADLAELTGHTAADPLAYTEVVLTASPGTDQAALRRRVAAALAGWSATDPGPVPAGYRVDTGATLRAELARQAAKYVDGFLRVLIGLGLVIVTMAGFVIYNTFTILAAQRGRELALLRCVGAGRRQVAGTVLGESLLLGLVSSAGGLLVSVLIAYGLILGRGLIGLDIPVDTLVVGWSAVTVAFGFGTSVTVGSALAPAVRAGRVAPLDALRHAQLADAPLGRRRGLRVATAAALILLGSGGAVAGQGAGFAALPLLLGGAMLALVGLIVLAPLLVGRLTAVLGWPLGRLFGAPARLAAANARRNPRRVAATTTALMIGVALMSMLSVLLATARAQSGRELTENFPVEFVLRPATGELFRAWGARYGGTDGVPEAAVAALRAQPEFATVAAVRTTQSLLTAEAPAAGTNPAPSRAGGTPPPRVTPLSGTVEVWSVAPGGLRGPVVPEVLAGDPAALPPAGPAPGSMALQRDLAERLEIEIGDRVELSGFGRLTVVALYDDAPTRAEALISWAEPGWADQRPATAGAAATADEVLVDVRPGVPTLRARQALDAALRPFPLVRVDSLAERSAELTAALNELLGIFAALLGMAVVVAVVGIGNTLALSVLERTRESATLRALGLSRRQLRGMFLCEAALMAALGSISGAAFGVAAGWMAALGLITTYGHGLPTVPVPQLVLVIVLATLAAVVAGVLPARQANRAALVAAMREQ